MTDDNETVTEDGEIIDAEILGEPLGGNDLVVRETFTPSKIEGGMAHFDEYLQLADRIAKTAMVPTALRGNGDQVLAVFMYGAELGMGPMQALNQINFIEGQPSLKPEAMRALIRKAGHTLDISKSNFECVITGTRGDTGEVGEASFSIDDAERANLLIIVNAETGEVRARSKEGKPKPWEMYTQDMLLARATSRIGRMMFSDVIAGLSYTQEEVESFTEPKEPRKATGARKARQATKKATTTRSAPQGQEQAQPATNEQKVQLATLLSELNEPQEEALKAEWAKLMHGDPPLPPKRLLVTYEDHVRAIALVNSVANPQPEGEVEGMKKGGDVKPRPAAKGKITQLNILFGERGFGDREIIHEYCAKVIGQPVASTKDLTTAQVNHIIDQLKSDAGQ